MFFAYCSVNGSTAKAAEKLCEIIKSKTDKKVSIADLSRTDLAEDIEDAFRFSRMVVIAPSYDGGVFPIMNDFLHHLKIKAVHQKLTEWSPKTEDQQEEKSCNSRRKNQRHSENAVQNRS